MENTKTPTIISGSNIADFDEKLRIIEEKNKIIPGKFSHETMMAALYYMWDAFDRSAITFFLIGQTGKACLGDKPLNGDKIEIGMRYNERHSGAWRIFTNFATPLKEENDKIYFEHEGVPIVCTVFAEDTFFDSPVPQFWQYETFNIPNPYAGYVAKYEASL